MAYSAFTAISSLSGTALQIDASSGQNPVISIDPAYPGQTSFTELGTVVIGQWEATPVAIQWGGTNATTASQALTNLGALPIAGGTMTGNLILNANPTNALGAVTKQYADALIAGLTFIASCYAGTTANLNAVYVNGASGVGATLTNAGSLAGFSTDGISPPINSRILVKNQSTGAQNGVYSLTTVGSGAAAWILTRTTDYDTAGQMAPGDFILINNGNTLTATGWIETATITTVGTDPLMFSQFGNPGTVTSVSGTALQIDVSNGTSTPVISIDAGYVGQTSLTTLGTITTGTWNGTTIAVAHGGTGNTTFTAYSVICAGTTATGAFQNVVGLGSSGQVLTSAGASALPAWQTPSTGTVTSVSGTALQIDVATGTTTPVISIDAGYVGQTSITTLGTISTGTWAGTNVALNHGGTNAALTASNGGIFYSTASAGAILAGTATANQVLLSGSSTTPAWSTATYPATTTINQILYSSSANVIAGLATANNGVLLTNGSGVPSIGTATVPVGGTGNTTFTAYSLIAAGTTATGAFQNVVGVGNSGQILVSAGASALPTWSDPSGLIWVDQTGSSVTMTANRSYVADNAGLVTFTLPTTAAFGSIFQIVGYGAGGWAVAQNSGQSIHLGNVTTTTGASGSLASSNRFDCVEIVCVVANTTFVAYDVVGNITYV